MNEIASLTQTMDDKTEALTKEKEHFKDSVESLTKERDTLQTQMNDQRYLLDSVCRLFLFHITEH